jgi:hypothetical protein
MVMLDQNRPRKSLSLFHAIKSVKPGLAGKFISAPMALKRWPPIIATGPTSVMIDIQIGPLDGIMATFGSRPSIRRSGSSS